ncbi:MAG: DUF1778 domain-containing protein [Bifidobacteriaceae bacterium]|jgi:antitoxin component of RelBE/YafQ-DinJ toxin-antitoxin module|nr:DUF1778 domain-containing protein [Bifidobacteriaceae bacterium]
MSDTSLIHLRTTSAQKRWLQRAADNFGLPLSTFVLKAAQQVADSGELVIKADLTPTPWLAAQIEQAAAEEPEAVFDLPRDHGAMDAYLSALAGE